MSKCTESIEKKLQEYNSFEVNVLVEYNSCKKRYLALTSKFNTVKLKWANTCLEFTLMDKDIIINKLHIDILNSKFDISPHDWYDVLNIRNDDYNSPIEVYLYK